MTPKMIGLSFWPANFSVARTSFSLSPIDFSLWPESSMIGDGCAVTMVFSDYKGVLCRHALYTLAV